jgi:hypothetical protein
MSIHDVIQLITAFASYVWPVTVLILACAFHRPIERLIERINRLKVGENAIEFGSVPSDRLFLKLVDEMPTAKEVTKKQLTAPSSAKWENVGNVFWLGGDLIWTAQSALRGAPRDRILHALRQSYHHISELGLAESAAGKQLASMKSDTENLAEADLDRAWRSSFSEKLYGVTRRINDLLLEQQPGFRPDPQS